MSWIETISPAAAGPELLAIYEAIASSRGGVADIHQVQSKNPRALSAHLELYKAVVFGRSTLSRVRRERIGVVVSSANACRYCVAHHVEALRRLGEGDAIVEPLGRGEIPTSLPDLDRALLAWAQLGAKDPQACKETEIRGLRALGLDDRAILDGALTIAYFSFVNRIVLLLGVEVEAEYKDTCGPGDEDATSSPSAK